MLKIYLDVSSRGKGCMSLMLIFDLLYFEMVEVASQKMTMVMILKKKVKMERQDDENGRIKEVRSELSDTFYSLVTSII